MRYTHTQPTSDCCPQRVVQLYQGSRTSISTLDTPDPTACRIISHCNHPVRDTHTQPISECNLQRVVQLCWRSRTSISTLDTPDPSAPVAAFLIVTTRALHAHTTRIKRWSKASCPTLLKVAHLHLHFKPSGPLCPWASPPGAAKSGTNPAGSRNPHWQTRIRFQKGRIPAPQVSKTGRDPGSKTRWKSGKIS